MDDEKLKLILAVLGGIVFSLVFVLLAFVLPLQGASYAEPHKAKEGVEKNPQERHLAPPPSSADSLEH